MDHGHGSLAADKELTRLYFVRQTRQLDGDENSEILKRLWTEPKVDGHMNHNISAAVTYPV